MIKKEQIIVIVVISNFITLVMVATFALLLGRANASPISTSTSERQIVVNDTIYISVSSMAFMPLSQDIAYSKNITRQILSLSNQTRSFRSNLFAAPLTLPDGSTLTGMVIFGEDFDKQGAVKLRLKRCNHSQARCVLLTETASTDSYAFGRFETVKPTVLSELIDNRFYSYFLELELTAVANSGLRSVRVEIVDNQLSESLASGVEKWTLSGAVTIFTLPNLSRATVRICADDLSHLNNPTHYPSLVVDGNSQILSSNQCVTVTGLDISARRKVGTGSSSGTYQFLR